MTREHIMIGAELREYLKESALKIIDEGHSFSVWIGYAELRTEETQGLHPIFSDNWDLHCWKKWIVSMKNYLTNEELERLARENGEPSIESARNTLDEMEEQVKINIICNF